MTVLIPLPKLMSFRSLFLDSSKLFLVAFVSFEGGIRTFKACPGGFQCLGSNHAFDNS